MVDKRATRFKKLRYRLLLYLVIALTFAMPIRTALEHHFLYFPEEQQETSPASVGLRYEAATFPALDGTQLNGWLIPGQPKAPVVLFCMGNAGNMSHRIETLRLLHSLGVAVFIFDYRGYGTSRGKCSEEGTYDDIAGALQFLSQRGWSSEQTVIFGRSLGAAIALEASLKNPPAGLIMESPFSSIKAMGHHHYPLLNRLLGWMIGAKYDNLEKIAALKSPLLIIHGSVDSICPPRMAEELYTRAPQEKQLYWIEGADHNNGLAAGGESYRQKIGEVIAKWTGFETVLQ